MQVRVERLWRGGKLIPRWQLGQLETVIGDLLLEESKDEHLRRNLRTARLLRPLGDRTGSGDLLPPLIDAAILYVKGNRISISGFERDDTALSSAITYAQTWLVEVISCVPTTDRPEGKS